jgi:hypothetical protein
MAVRGGAFRARVDFPPPQSAEKRQRGAPLYSVSAHARKPLLLASNGFAVAESALRVSNLPEALELGLEVRRFPPFSRPLAARPNTVDAA